MTRTFGWPVAALVGTLALVAACTSNSGSRSDRPSSSTTVAVRDTSATGNVLVDARGRTLYTSDQEKAAGKILCQSSGCVAIWTPLTVTMGEKPSGPSGVSDRLSTISRPDGSSQVAFMGEALYTFSFDHSAGDVNGNGVKDSFSGTDFTWHAATANGVAATPGSSNGSTPGYGYRRY